MVFQQGAAACWPSVDLTLGQIISTPGVINALANAQQNPVSLLDRHRYGDWGDVGSQDWALNDRAVTGGDRVLSVYRLKDGIKVWIITEADRSATTLLLPDEYLKPTKAIHSMN
jgi:hypothetical protein